MMVTSFPGTDSTRSTVPCSLSTVNMGIHSKIPTAFILSTLLLSVLLSANCTYTSYIVNATEVNITWLSGILLIWLMNDVKLVISLNHIGKNCTGCCTAHWVRILVVNVS